MTVKITGKPDLKTVRILLESILAWKLHKEAKIEKVTIPAAACPGGNGVQPD